MKSTKYAVIVACLALAASGCGSAGQPDARPASAGEGAAQQNILPGGPSGSGKVAAVSGSTAQVQNPNGQVAVTWTRKTTFTQEVVSRAAALKVGACVVATPAESGSGADGTENEEGNESDDSTVAAVAVHVTTKVDGSCGGALPRTGPGTGPGQAPGQAPDDSVEQPPDGDPRPAPEDAPRRVVAPGAVGEVTALSGSGFTVESVGPGPESGPDSETSTEVTTTAATRWTTTRAATAKAVVVGRCVTSLGRADSTGAVTADSIAVSSPVDGECLGGFGGPGLTGPGQGDEPGQGTEPGSEGEQTS